MPESTPDPLRAVLDAVAAAFARLGGDDLGWPPPREPMESPRDDEYSVVADPGKYRILELRARAWVETLVDAGLGTASEVEPEEWVGDFRGRADVDHVVRVVPVRPGGLVLFLRRTIIDGDSFGYDIGISDGDGPPVLWRWAPHCGCDACDDGSERLLEEFDGVIRTVLRGGVVHARRGDDSATRTDVGLNWSGGASEDWLDPRVTAARGVRRWAGEPWL